MTNRPESHIAAAAWHLERASLNVLRQDEHIAIAQVEALIAIAEALRATDRPVDAA
jgi:hypothetical protein